MLDRRVCVKEFLSDRADLLVVSGLGAPTYDVAACGDHPLNFYLWGAMGGAAMVGLGLALAKPQRRVAVVTGDGEMLMGLGSLATIGVKQPSNLSIIVIDNRHYGETGMQESATHFGIDLLAVARACRFNVVEAITRETDIAPVRAKIHSSKGPAFIQAHVAPGEAPRVLPLRDGQAIKLRFMSALGT